MIGGETKIMSFIDKILYILYPEKCAFCGKVMPHSETGVYICPECMDKIRFCVNESCCSICGTPIDQDKNICGECFDLKKSGGSMNYDRIISACVYDENTKGGILNFKRGFASGSYKTFGGMIAASVSVKLKKIDLIAAVPPRKERMRNPGFDQCDILAAEVSKRLEIPYRKNILRRVRETTKQTSLSGDMRRENLFGAFEVKIDPGFINKKNILVIDDVKTTGSTFNECARALKEKGAAHVYGASVAETDFENS